MQTLLGLSTNFLAHDPDNPLISAVQNSIGKAFKGEQLKRDLADGKKPPPYIAETPAEAHSLVVFGRFMAVSKCLDRCDQALFCLNHYPSGKVYSAAEITRPVWLDYHLSQFISNLASLSDVSLLLVDAVCDLRNDPRVCSAKVVFGNAWVSHKAETAWKRLDKHLQPYKEKRNKDFHRAERPCVESIINAEDYWLVSATTWLNQHGPNVVAPKMLARLAQAAATDVRTKLGSIAQESVPLLQNLWDALRPEYARAQTRLRNQWAAELKSEAKKRGLKITKTST